MSTSSPSSKLADGVTEEQLIITLPTSILTPEAVCLPGELLLPANPAAFVVVAHPTASSSLSSRSHVTARHLTSARVAVLLADLLSARERDEDALQGRWGKEIGLLERRLDAVIAWARQQRPQLRGLPLGLVGVSTGSAAALVRETHHDDVRAVASRGGMPHLADPVHLAHVLAPTLLVVASGDAGLLQDNRAALDGMTACRHKRLHIVRGATHLLGEDGAMEEVARVTTAWMCRWLIDRPTGDRGAGDVAETGESETRSEAHEGKAMCT